MVKIHMMKAHEGDFIWVSYGNIEDEYHVLIDGGTKVCGERYANAIKTLEHMELKEFYRPETYFSTAQLNTVAFSSFFGRALSANNLPVKAICIDDPIGHFDDMNIWEFTDMIRCILEK